jgi:hypothetical protein
MRAYRCYILDDEDHIRFIEVVRALTDDEAVDTAQAICAEKYEGYPLLELFEQSRLEPDPKACCRTGRNDDSPSGRRLLGVKRDVVGGAPEEISARA